MFKLWKDDFRSSVVVFLIAIPLCLGIALASNAPLTAGLYAGIIGGIVVGYISGSPISVSGPSAGLAVIVASTIHDLGSFEAFTMALFFAGVIQILFGLFKGGIIGDFFPASVIKGMLAAIGMILILKQFPHAVGYDADFMGDENFIDPGGQNTFSRLVSALNFFQPSAVIISSMTLILIWAWDQTSTRGSKFFQFIPGPLVAVILAIIVNQLLGLISPSLVLDGNHLVSLPYNGGFSDFFQSFYIPSWSHVGNIKIFAAAGTLALVASLESLLSVDAADKMDDAARNTDKNRELIAQGVGNVLSGFIGGLPITSVIVRSSANATAGAKTNLSTILHGVWLALSIIVFPSFLNSIPLSALAGILIYVGYRLTKPSLVKKIYERGPDQFIPYAVTIVAILLTNLLSGILIGIFVGFIFVMKSNFHKSIVMVSDDNFYLIRFYKDVSFLQKATLQKMLNRIPSGASVVIDGSNSVFVDNDIAELIEDFLRRGTNLNIKISLKKSPLALSPIFKEL